MVNVVKTNLAIHIRSVHQWRVNACSVLYVHNIQSVQLNYWLYLWSRRWVQPEIPPRHDDMHSVCCWTLVICKLLENYCVFQQYTAHAHMSFKCWERDNTWTMLQHISLRKFWWFLSCRVYIVESVEIMWEHDQNSSTHIIVLHSAHTLMCVHCVKALEDHRDKTNPCATEYNFLQQF